MWIVRDESKLSKAFCYIKTFAKKCGRWKHSPAMSSNSAMTSLSNKGGNLFEKKSFKAVATAFTGTSRASMHTLVSGSGVWFDKM